MRVIQDDKTGYSSKEYAVKIKCENCGSIYWVAISKGRLAGVEVRMEPCPNCSCADVLRVMK